MSRKLLSLSLSAMLMAGTAMAEVPKVAVDIAPLHSLVARVMDRVGSPDLIIPAGASPHQHTLRPSEARALQDAEVVFWLGEELTPWMENAIDTLAADADVTALLEADGTVLHAFREGALFEAHDHEDEAHGHDEKHEYAEHSHGDEDAHEEHAEAKDDHGDEHAHDDHGHEEHGHEEHAHGEHDPHAWLSPTNAVTWLDLIAGKLSAADPDNAGTYFANAAAGKTELEALYAEVNALLEPVRKGNFIVFHDAYQYFEMDFDFPAAGAISIGDATDPSPARISEVQSRIREQGVDCVLAEPQFNQSLVATLLEGTDAKTAIIDPIGVELELGPNLYPQLIRNLATNLAECL